MCEITYLITGGAGSLGRRLIKDLLKQHDTQVIRVLDHNENGLVRLKRVFQDSRIRFLLGDIRDKPRVIRAMENVDVCVHAAAQKHVDISEFNPFECICINVTGTQNCVDAALECNINKFLFVSSDKAVEPIGTYGKCKSLAESLTLDANTYKGDRPTKFSVIRPPNYLRSDGSVHELWKHQLAHKQPLTVTHPHMTRYFMTFEEITAFTLKCLSLMEGGEIFVPANVKEHRILDLAEKLSKNIKIVGRRKGEKLHETLMTLHEKENAINIDGVWVIK